MKKTISIFLILCLVFGAIGCLDDDKPQVTTVPANGSVTVINSGQNNNDDFWMWMYLTSSWHNHVYMPYQHTRTYVTRTVYVPTKTKISKSYSTIKPSYKPVSNSEIKARNSQAHGFSPSTTTSKSKGSFFKGSGSSYTKSSFTKSSFSGVSRGRR
jgi:hypothetical protein